MKAIFLDKDGTLIENVPYSVDPAAVKLLPGVAQGLRELSGAGYQLFVVTNQSGVARGYFPESALAGIAARLRDLLAHEAGVPLTGFYYCPHHPQGIVRAYAVDCMCRKPRPGLLQQAAAEHGLDLGECWMIGDILDDVAAGRAAGCRTVLVANGNETEWILTPERRPHLVVPNLVLAARLLVACSRQEPDAPLPSTAGGNAC